MKQKSYENNYKSIPLFYGPYLLKYQKYILKIKICNYILKYEQMKQKSYENNYNYKSIHLFYGPYILIYSLV